MQGTFIIFCMKWKLFLSAREKNIEMFQKKKKKH